MTVLLSTFHDPEGRFLRVKGIEKVMEKAADIYDNSLINITKNTSPGMRKLAEKYFSCISSENISQGHHVMRLLKNALKYDGNFHYCDFDRLLHWQKHYPDELRQAVSRVSKIKGFVFICRSKRAFKSHPDTQKDTESVMNMIASRYLGKAVDAGSGTVGFDKRTCNLLSEISGDISGVRFVGRFIRCIKENDIRTSCIEVEGMEWETPDIYQKEIASLGYKEWIRQFQSHAEWRKRVDMMRQIVEAFQ
ncbi:MAG: hypothetical protein QMD85_00185 [Candidatus Aenigmarchaeota archaeon]|nr:hypothetical protein [Candidatus Aenigmarchaeota archaeon]MDI6721945.1 hypothetical protein [Candidatus Aenigmarchaeota archaeon]